MKIKPKKQMQSLFVLKEKPGSELQHADPDDQVKSLDPVSAAEEPKIFNMVRRGDANPQKRRQFIKNLAGAAGITALAGVLTECKRSEYMIRSDDDECTCHAMCTCDTVGDSSSSMWESRYNGTVCICDTVCSCNTVCTCNTQGGNTYWYPN